MSVKFQVRIITFRDIKSFEWAVSNSLNRGWVRDGPFKFENGVYSQHLIKITEEKDEQYAD